MAIDAAGNLYIAWISDDAVGISWEGASWHHEVVADVTYVGGNIEIELDSLGQVHLTYFDGDTNELIYALGSPIPEPATVVLLSAGIAFLAALRRRKRGR